MIEYKTFIGVFGLLCALCVSVASKPALAASEADWFYQAAALEARFEKISSAQIPWADKAKDYYALLDDVRKFEAAALPAEANVGQAPSPVNKDAGVAQPPSAVNMSDRERRGRKAFALLCTGWIQQMLADSDSANKTQAEYKTFLATMPDDERAIATGFFEKQYQKSPVCMPRVCTVEGRGKEVRVTAVDWPIRDLLQRMAEATGEKIDIPKEVSGLVDYSPMTPSWEGVDGAIMLFVMQRGLAMNDSVAERPAGTPLRVRIVDPLYTASISERTSKCKDLIGLVKPAKGIATGVVLLFGRYISPPYVLESRNTDKVAQVLLNGVPIDKGLQLTWTVKPMPPLEEAVTSEQVSQASGLRYAALKQQFGKEEALKQIQAELERHPLVKEVKVGGEEATLTLTNGDRFVVVLRLFPPPEAIADAGAITARRRETNTKRIEEQKRQLERVLQEKGLLVIASSGRIVSYRESEARKRLAVICDAMQEVTRFKEAICWNICDYGWEPGASEVAWEVLANLRHRELLAALAGNGPE
jgi:hypothetical protein